nr:hypothetical protein [Methanobacterium formicicum]
MEPKKYSDEIAKYLDENVESWEGSEAQLTKKKGKNKQLNGKKSWLPLENPGTI